MTLQGRIGLFISSIGTDIKSLLSLVPLWYDKKTTSSTLAVTTTSTTFTDITALTLSLPSAGTYIIEGYLGYLSSSAICGVGVKTTVTNATLVNLGVEIFGQLAAGTDNSFIGVIGASADSIVSTATIATASQFPINIIGRVVVSAASTVTFSAARSTSTANPTITIAANSIVLARKIF